MEGIITLVVIIIVFNLINALIKGLRGDRSVEKRTTPAGIENEGETFVSPLKKERIDPFHGLDVYEELSEPEPAAEPETEYEADPVPEPVISSRPDPQPDTYKQLQREKSKAAAKKLPLRPSVTESTESVNIYLERSLKHKEPLVAAFIFHEIFGPPLAQRHKR